MIHFRYGQCLNTSNAETSSLIFGLIYTSSTVSGSLRFHLAILLRDATHFYLEVLLRNTGLSTIRKCAITNQASKGTRRNPMVKMYH